MKFVEARPNRERTNEIIYGDGKYRYRVNFDWPCYPEVLKDAVITGAYCDSQDRLFVLSRSKEMPISVFAPDGSFLYSCAKGLFYERPHGIFINDQDELYCTDDKADIVLKLSTNGELLQTFGKPYTPSDSGCYDIYKELWDTDQINKCGGYDNAKSLQMKLNTIVRTAPPFNGPTKMIETKSGKLFCSDGYGNAAVHRFDKDGNHELTWGAPGVDLGQFRLPHAVLEDAQGRIWEADRESSRVQVFTQDGEQLACISGLHRPADLWTDGEVIYVGEIGGGVSIIDMDYQIVAQLGYQNCPLMVHGICNVI